jgi:hypothetical protein
MENKRIICTNPDGSVAIIIPAKNTKLSIEEIARKDAPAGSSTLIVEKEEIPSDRSYRNAWNFDGVSKKIGHDMAKAKEIHKEKLRALRAPKLAALDVEYQKADEENKPQLKAQIAAKKKKLRDVTASPAIEAAQTIEELKVAGLSDLEV